MLKHLAPTWRAAIKFAADNKETLAVLASIAVGAKTGSMFSAPGAILGGVVAGGITAQKTGGFEKLGVGLSHFISGITGLDDEIEELTKDFVKVEKAAAAAAGDADSSGAGGAGGGGLAGVSEATKTLIKDLREEVSWLKLEARALKEGEKFVEDVAFAKQVAHRDPEIRDRSVRRRSPGHT